MADNNININAKQDTKGITFNSTLWIVAGALFILLVFLANFPVIEFSILGVKNSFHVIPLAVQLILKFVLNVIVFFALIIFIIVFHIFLIRQIIDLIKIGQKSIDSVIAWLDSI